MVSNFVATDSRMLSLVTGESVTGFNQEGQWICGFKDTNKGVFGFAPLKCLQLERLTRSGSPTKSAAVLIN